MMRSIEQIRPAVNSLKQDVQSSEKVDDQSLFEEFQDYLSKIASHSTISDRSSEVLDKAISESHIDFVKNKENLPVQKPNDYSDQPLQIKQQELSKPAQDDRDLKSDKQSEDSSKDLDEDISKNVNNSDSDASEKEEYVSESKAEQVETEVKDLQVSQHVVAEINQANSQITTEKASDDVSSGDFSKLEGLEFDKLPSDTTTKSSAEPEELEDNINQQNQGKSEKLPDNSLIEQNKQISSATKTISNDVAKNDTDSQIIVQNDTKIIDSLNIKVSDDADNTIHQQPKAEQQLDLNKGLNSWLGLSEAVSQFLALSSSGILKQSMANSTQVQSGNREVSAVEAKGGANPFSQNQFLNMNSGFAQAQSSESKSINQRVKPLPKAMESKAFERVEQVLKEAVKSKDGKSISFRLDPPQLGKMQIDVSFKDGALHARIVPESQQVGNIIRDRAHELVNSLRKLGLNVEKISLSVSEQVAFEDSGFSGMHQDFSNHEEKNGDHAQKAKQEGNSLGEEVRLEAARISQKINNLDHWVA